MTTFSTFRPLKDPHGLLSSCGYAPRSRLLLPTGKDPVALSLHQKGVAGLECNWFFFRWRNRKTFWKDSPPVCHQDILTGLLVQIDLYIQRKKGKCRVFPAPFNIYIKSDKHNFVLSDIALICEDEKMDQKGCHGALDFVVEIVSPSNRKMDYVRKPVLYWEAGVREYWIVDPKHRQVTVYDLEHDAEPVLYPSTERIRVVVYDDLYLNLTNLHGTLEEVLIEERQSGHAEGIAEGLEKGRAEGEDVLRGCLSF